MAAHICSSIRQYVCFCIYKSLILPHVLLSPFLCDAPSHNSRPDPDLFLHTLWKTPKRFCHGSASLWLGLMHLFALPQPPLTTPRFSLWTMGKPINPDCVMVKASKSDKNVSQIVYHGSSCLSLSDSTPPPNHKPRPVLVLLSMNHQLPCALTEIRRFSHTYAKYQRCISASKIRKCFQFHPNFGVRHQSPLSFSFRICWLRFRLAKPENIRGRMPFLLPCVATVQSLLRRAFRITTRSTSAANRIDVVEPVFDNVSMITPRPCLWCMPRRLTRLVFHFHIALINSISIPSFKFPMSCFFTQNYQ